jgi:hypothetical protein
MELNNFRFNVVLRVCGVFVLCLVLVWGVLNTTWVATPVVCGGILLLSVFELIWYVERTARDLTGFLTFVAHHDFSTLPSVPGKGPVFTQLHAAYGLLGGEFRRLNRQKAANHQYLEAVV